MEKVDGMDENAWKLLKVDTMDGNYENLRNGILMKHWLMIKCYQVIKQNLLIKHDLVIKRYLFSSDNKLVMK